MLNFLHAADLHLSLAESDRDYGFEILREIVALATEHQVDGVLLSGDIFDTPAAARELRSSFCTAWQNFNGPVFYIPGNHEDSGRGYQDLALLDWAPVRFLPQLPCTFLSREETGGPFEVLAIPHQPSVLEWRRWEIPPKGDALRLVLAHGVVPGMCYQGPEGEAGGGVLDPLMFKQWGVSYVALGHIHDRRALMKGGVHLGYPGSARVWRAGEEGPRQVSLVTHKADLAVQGITLKSAGLYHGLNLTLGGEGGLPALPANMRLGAHDYLDIELTGVACDLFQLKNDMQAWSFSLPPLRKVTWNTDKVIFSSELGRHPLVARFLEVWRQQTPSTPRDQEIWLKARDLGLGLLQQRLGDPP